MVNLRRAMTWLACLGVVGLLLGCNRPSTPTFSGPPPGPPGVEQGTFDSESGPFAAGKKVVVANGCFRCHSIDGVRGPVGGGPGLGMGRGRGPDLGKVGDDPAHTVEWFIAYIRNPKATKPDSRMPSFEGKIKEEELRTLAEYLASLK